jgi:hypothetical protein
LELHGAARDDRRRTIARNERAFTTKRTMLPENYNWFTEGFDTADLKDAKALLDELHEDR